MCQFFNRATSVFFAFLLKYYAENFPLLCVLLTKFWCNQQFCFHRNSTSFLVTCCYPMHNGQCTLSDKTSNIKSDSVAQWLGRWTCDWRSRVQSQPLHCRVQLWSSCSHTLSSASGVATLWCYSLNKKNKKISAWRAKIPKCGRLSRPALWSTFGHTIKQLDFTFFCKKVPGPDLADGRDRAQVWVVSRCKKRQNKQMHYRVFVVYYNSIVHVPARNKKQQFRGRPSAGHRLGVWLLPRPIQSWPRKVQLLVSEKMKCCK